MLIPSPIFIYGDNVLAKREIVKLKNKFSNYEWAELSLESSSLDTIRFESGIVGFGYEEKFLILKDLVNLKYVRDFILSLSKSCRKDTKIIIWDSNEVIKKDPKNLSINETWSEFIQQIKEIKNSKIISFDVEFSDNIIETIKNSFAQRQKNISNDAATTLVEIVGKKRNLIFSEIEKLSLICDKEVSKSFILENAFPMHQEAILWKFNEVIDSGNFATSIRAMKEFIENGVHPNVLAEMLCKKARWQLAATHLWASGMPWTEIEQSLMNMGKFPSSAWRSNISISEKKFISDSLKKPANALKWLCEKMRLPEDYFPKLKIKGAKIKSGESIPMLFLAQQISKHIQVKIIKPNINKFSSTDLKQKILDRSIASYQKIIESMKNMRYNSSFEQELYEMVRALSDYRI